MNGNATVYPFTLSLSKGVLLSRKIDGSFAVNDGFFQDFFKRFAPGFLCVLRVFAGQSFVLGINAFSTYSDQFYCALRKISSMF